jgi:anti-anti-sigma regulatory factor
MTGKQLFEFELLSDVLIVTPNGPFIEFRYNDFRNAYNETYRLLSEPGTRHLLIDFSNLDYFGSTFVSLLLRLSQKARTCKGEAALCHLSDNMRGMLKTLMLLENPKVDFSMSSHANREVALQYLTDLTSRANEKGE